jgi:hypothetical protein
VRNALYYPHTHIRSEAMLRTALLLWDSLTIIAPFQGFRPRYNNAGFQEAFDVIGRYHVPTQGEKRKAHELIEDFATRPLPDSFYYQESVIDSRVNRAKYGISSRNNYCEDVRSSYSTEREYEIFARKLLPETWRMLRDVGLAGNEDSRGDVCTPEVTGLGIMSLLADCCAGESLARVTDREAAYAALSNLFTYTDKALPKMTSEAEQLIPITVATINIDNIPLQRLIDFRKEEASVGGHFIRDLRHRLREKLEVQAAQMAQMKSHKDREQIQEEFKSDMQDDLATLRQALRLETSQAFGWKEIGTAALASGVLATITSSHPMVLSYTVAAGAIGGLLATRSKFVRTRQKILQEHPMAYVYELAGGLRL